MPNIEIRDRDGALLHAGEAATRKALIQSLVATGRSLARADLSDQDLKRLDLTGADLRGALLDGAKMRGTVLDRADLEDASMRGVAAPGLTARRSNLSCVDLGPHPETGAASSLAGAELSYSTLDRARLDGCDLSEAGLSSSTLLGVRATRANFSKSSAHNTDWTFSTTVGCDFTDADLTTTMRADARHLPDRTRGSTAVGNTFTGAKLGGDVPAFVRDRAIGRVTELASFGGIAAAAFVAGTYVPFDGGESFIAQALGQGAPFLIVACAASIVAEKIGDGIKDGAKKAILAADKWARANVTRLVRAGAAVGSLAVAMADRATARVVVSAVRDGGGFAATAARAAGGIHVIVCDRRSLARALAHLSDGVEGRNALGRDTMIVRRGSAEGDHAPRAVLLRRDGGATAYWDAPWGGPAKASWDAEGRVSESSGYMGGLAQWGNLRLCVRGFMRSALASAGLDDPAFDLESHRVRDGLDGSVVVLRRKDARLDNPHGPAILAPGGVPLWFRNGAPSAVPDAAPAPAPAP